jgi:hypothetical protein
MYVTQCHLGTFEAGDDELFGGMPLCALLGTFRLADLRRIDTV